MVILFLLLNVLSDILYLPTHSIPYFYPFSINKNSTKRKENANHKEIWSLFCVSQLLLSMRVCMIYSVPLHWRKLIFLLPVAITWNGFWNRDENLYQLLLPYAGILPSLNLWKSCVCCHSLCAFICASVLCLEDIVLCNHSPPLPYICLNLERRVLIKTSNLVLKAPRYLILCILSSYWSLC